MKSIRVAIIALLITVGFAGTALLASPAPASADGKYAPACVERVVTHIDTVKVHIINHCSTTQRISIHFALTPDSGCYTLTPGDDEWFGRPGWSRYQHTVVC
jgi:hypothetical protein